MARGSWFFEACFPVLLLDANGEQLAEVPAQAEGEWMTDEFVPFRAELSFSQPRTVQGVLVLQRANASGLPEHDAELRVPIVFGSREK